MAFNCRLNKNITLNNTTEEGLTNGCGSNAVATGGIRERIYVYNIDDIQNLMFENDMRYDNNLVVETIITQGNYYYIDCTSVEYNEAKDNKLYTHTLTLTLANITTEFEDILNDASNNRYLVAFRPNGEDNYRIFGWKHGADLTYDLNITSDTGEYSVTFSDESEYPLMAAYSDNFKLDTKIFKPIFKPLYDIAFCETNTDGTNTGYVIASYVVKTNSAGLALDSDNKLCSLSGKPQDAYKLENVGDGGYNILGTYTETASFDGQPVKIFNVNICKPNAKGTISISPTSVVFDSTTTDSTLNLTTNNSWKAINIPNTVYINSISGTGNANISMVSNNMGGDGELTFRNTKTYEEVNVSVSTYIISVEEEQVYPSGTQYIMIVPEVQGGDGTYDYNVTSGSQYITSITKNDEGNLVIALNVQKNETSEINITLSHHSYPTESKNVHIIIQGINDKPIWSLVSRYCETK